MRSLLMAFPVVAVLACAAAIAESAEFLVGPGDPMMLPDGCETCNQPAAGPVGMQPPWHRNVRPPMCGPRGCGPGMVCGPCVDPGCDPCCEPECSIVPPCFPRLHAMFREGYLLSPTPPRPPRCPQCGYHIPGGF